MSQSRREREYARKRQEKWQQRHAEKVARRRRNQLIGGIVAAAAVVVAIVVIVVIRLGGNGEPTSDYTDPRDWVTPLEDVTDLESLQASLIPDPALAEDRSWNGVIKTSVGELTVRLDGHAAPQATANFIALAQSDYFTNTPCHRLTTDGIFVLQCGDPTGTGSGGPGYSWGPIENAPADNLYPKGTLAMARVGGDGSSMGSQFFIVYADSTIGSDAAGGYTVFGSVESGLDAVEAVAAAGVEGGASDGAPATPVTIEGVSVE